MTTVSTASLIVPPSASLVALKVESSASTHAKRRCGPIRTLSGLGGAPWTAAAAIAASPATLRPACAPALSGLRSVPRASSSGPVTRSASASANISALLGAGRGAHAGPGSGSGGSGSRSKSTVMMSTPLIPSTSAWWVLAISAKRPSAIVSTSHISHSGLSRSSCWANTRPASERS